MAKKISDIVDESFIQLFKAVGLNYSKEQALEYAEQDEWYTNHTWTEEQEKGFRNWMDAKLKPLGWSAKTRQREIGMFLLNYGWKRG